MANALLLRAAAGADRNSVAVCLDTCCADVNASNINATTALHYAASRGDPELIRVLVGKGGDLTAQEISGSGAFIPLHRAVLAGHAEAAAVLVELGSDVEARDALHRTPVLLACALGHNDAALAMAKAGADLTAVDGGGKTCMYWLDEHARLGHDSAQQPEASVLADLLRQAVTQAAPGTATTSVAMPRYNWLEHHAQIRAIRPVYMPARGGDKKAKKAKAGKKKKGKSGKR